MPIWILFKGPQVEIVICNMYMTYVYDTFLYIVLKLRFVFVP